MRRERASLLETLATAQARFDDLDAAAFRVQMQRRELEAVRVVTMQADASAEAEAIRLRVAELKAELDALRTRPDETGIAHHEGDRAVLDLIREERPPFSPDAVTARFAADLQRYRVSTVVGDRYSGDWLREAFRKRGIGYQPSELPKSDIYVEFLPR